MLCLLGALLCPLHAQTVRPIRTPSAAATQAFAAPRVARVHPNDNRLAAGTLRDGTLTLHLVARLGEWHPDGESAPGVVLPAFAVEQGTPQIPGPLIRVAQGTVVAAQVRNDLPNDTLRVHGLYARPLSAPSDSQPLVIPPGATRDVRFRLGAVGTFYYWGTTTRRALSFRTGLDGQLTGAIVVDSAPNSQPRDRIFVIGSWTDTVGRSFLPRARVLGVLNGRSWPATERISASVGDSLTWRVINASGDLHPMHLHGFFFRVTSRGDGTSDTLLTPDRAPLEVTETATMGATYSMTWVPERAGNWLFHCHIPEHFGRRAPLGLPPDTMSMARAGHASHATGGMSGLVMGIAVRGPNDRATTATALGDAGRRQIRVLVRATTQSTAERPVFRYAWHEQGAEPAPDTGTAASAPLVLTRGQPVRITVVNRLAEPTAVHWHGIELESYYDGVPGFSGINRSVTPVIAPGDSFVVRFTPPRAGTFIYHTHYDEDRQQGAGLAGALLVMEPGTTYDPTTDHVILITSPFDFTEATQFLLYNGQEKPELMTVRVGETARFRLINMSTRRSGVRVRLTSGDSLVAWRAIAKDAAPVPPALGVPRASAHLVSIGETMDLEVVPRDTMPLRIEWKVGPLVGATTFGVQPLRVLPRQK